MKTKKFTIKVQKPKARRVLPPPGYVHKNRRNDYDHPAFKNHQSQSWD